MRLDSRNGGFTLIEILVVIAIVGILASIAIPQYQRFQMRSKSVEAKSNLAAIRSAQSAHFSEFGVYVAAEPTPALIPGSLPVVFAPVTSGFAELGFQPSGRVLFSYAIATSADGSGYTAEAAGDLDEDAATQYWAVPMPQASGALVPARIGCNVGNLTPRQLGPCDTVFGQSVF